MSRLSDQQSFDSDSTTLTFNTRFDGPSNEGDCLHPYTTLRMYGRLTNLRSTDLIGTRAQYNHFSTAQHPALPDIVGQGARVQTGYARPELQPAQLPPAHCRPTSTPSRTPAPRALSVENVFLFDTSPIKSTRITARTTLHKRIARVNCTGYVTHLWYCQCE